MLNINGKPKKKKKNVLHSKQAQNVFEYSHDMEFDENIIINKYVVSTWQNDLLNLSNRTRRQNGLRTFLPIYKTPLNAKWKTNTKG